MADIDTLIVTFQTQLSDVMETVVKTAMYEVTRLVEDSLLQELKARGQEVERLRAQLQRTENQLNDQGANVEPRTEECDEAIKDEDEKQKENSGFLRGGNKVDDVNSSSHVSKSALIHELEKSTASFSPVWAPQVNASDPVKLIDNIKKEAVEPTSCSSLTLEEWRVTLGEVRPDCQTTSARTEDDFCSISGEESTTCDAIALPVPHYGIKRGISPYRQAGDASRPSYSGAINCCILNSGGCRRCMAEWQGV